MSYETVQTACTVEVDFILSEMERHHLLAQSGASFAERFGEQPTALFELMAKLPHAATGKELVVGREALQRFHTIVKLVIEDRTDASDWDAAVLAKQLQDTFLNFVFQEGLEDTDAMVMPWIEAATRHVRSRHRRYLQYLPCVAVQIGDQTAYTFGAITFTQKALFYEGLTKSMSRYDAARSRLSERARKNAAPGMQWCWQDRPDHKGKSTEEIFREFTHGVDWIASIQVGRCDSSVSEGRAEAALRLALSSITLLLHGTEGAELRLAEDPSVPRHVNKISSPGKGVVRPSSSWKFGTPKTPEGWQEHLDTVAKPVLSIMHDLIDRTLAGAPLSYGYRIAMRAMSWYADAIRDTNVETRLIKCATAVESLVLPDRNNATATFVIRGALLAQRQNFSIAHWAVIARRLYERRSDVAHGNLDSLSAAQEESTRDALEFARNAILQFLVFCALPQFRGPTRTGSREDFVDLYEHCEGGQHAEIAQVVATQNFKGWKTVPAHNP